jgi:DNA-binding IclR family transcriptional regulator
MPSPKTIPVLERSIDLLSAIAESPFGLSAKELTLQLRIPQATCYRILRTLVQKHLLQERPNGSYLSAYGLARLARSWSGLENRLAEIKPQLEEMSRRTGLSAKISIREGACAVVVLRTEALSPNSITSRVGSKIPLAEAGSVGIMLLASVPPSERAFLLKNSGKALQDKILREAADARKEGCARSYGTHHPSIYAVSKPVDIGAPAAATLIGWPEDFAGKKRAKIENALRQSCAELSPCDLR